MRVQPPALWLTLSLVMVGCKPAPATAVPPKPLANAMPDPERIATTQAAKDGTHGAVRIAYCVDTDGKPQDLRVVEGLEPEFDALALATVAAWRFEPATTGGVPVEQCTDVRIELR
jgi:periplasmic protein TonB